MVNDEHSNIFPLGLPKAEIADLVEQEGIRVPQRFESATEAFSSGKDVIARTELPWDFDGPSGCIDSLRIRRIKYPDLFDDDPSEYILTYNPSMGHYTGIILEKYHRLAAYMNMTIEELKKQIRVSYWEYIEGENITVAQDHVFEGNHHILNPEWYKYYSHDDESLRQIVDMYTQVSEIMGANNNVPIMEFQVDNTGKAFFLQYHAGRRKQQPTPVEFPNQNDSSVVWARFCTGTTAQNGEKHTLVFARTARPPLNTQVFPAACDDLTYDRIYTQMQLWRGRRVQVFSHPSNIFFVGLANHTQTSIMLKPPISLGFTSEDVEKIAGENYWRKRDTDFIEIPVHIWSNGAKACMKRCR